MIYSNFYDQHFSNILYPRRKRNKGKITLEEEGVTTAAEALKMITIADDNVDYDWKICYLSSFWVIMKKMMNVIQ